MNKYDSIRRQYYPGKGCRCGAHDYGECCCEEVEWTPKVEKLVKEWVDMPTQEVRLRIGEATNGEIRTIKAVLRQILRDSEW